MVCAFFMPNSICQASLEFFIFYIVMENEIVYEQPQVEIISIEVEKGYAASDFTQETPGAWD